MKCFDEVYVVLVHDLRNTRTWAPFFHVNFFVHANTVLSLFKCMASIFIHTAIWESLAPSKNCVFLVGLPLATNFYT